MDLCSVMFVNQCYTITIFNNNSFVEKSKIDCRRRTSLLNWFKATKVANDVDIIDITFVVIQTAMSLMAANRQTYRHIDLFSLYPALGV